MMRVIFFTEGPLTPSTRFRVLQFLPLLKAQGISCTVKHFRNETFPFGEGLDGPRSYVLTARDLGRRLLDILSVSSYDVVFLQRDLVPWNTPLLEGLLTRMNKRVIFDFDDAIYLSSEGQHERADKVIRILRTVSVATVANETLRKFADPWVETVVIPMAIDADLFCPCPKPAFKEKVTVGWSGTPTNFPFLFEVRDTLLALIERTATEILVISRKQSIRELEGVPLKLLRWAELSELSQLRSIDVGIVPLIDCAQARGKFPIKLLQFMSLGIPTVCSPVGVVREVIEDGVNGFLAMSQEEWLAKLTELVESEALRNRMGEAARRTVQSRYSLEVVFPLLLRVLEKVSLR